MIRLRLPDLYPKKTAMFKRLIRKERTMSDKENSRVLITCVFSDKKLGDIFRIDADRHYFHFRMTPSGLLRYGPIVKQGEGEHLINGG